MADGDAATAGKQIPKLLQMLVMGCATVGAVCSLQPKYPLWEGFVNTPLLLKTGGPDTNFPLDLVVLSLSYVPLMIIAILCRDAGVGKAIMHLKTPYVPTLSQNPPLLATNCVTVAETAASFAKSTAAL